VRNVIKQEKQIEKLLQDSSSDLQISGDNSLSHNAKKQRMSFSLAICRQYQEVNEKKTWRRLLMMKILALVLIKKGLMKSKFNFCTI
jgi:hypothetical protein